MLMMKAGVFRPTRLVSLRKLERTVSPRIAAAPTASSRIGAMTPLAAVERSPEVARARAGDPARHAAALQHPRAQRRDRRRQPRPRRSAHGPAAGAHRARRAALLVAGPDGRAHACAVEDLFAGYYETVLAKNELIAELRVPAQGKTRAAYLKVTTGSADDWPALGVAVALEADGASDQIRARRGQRRDREGDPPHGGRDRCSPAPPSTTRRWRAPAMPRPRKPSASRDMRGSAAYKRELLRVYVGARRARRRSPADGATN